MSGLRRFGGGVRAAGTLLETEAVANEEATPGRGCLHGTPIYVLGLGGGAVHSSGGGAIGIASLRGGDGLHTQIHPLDGASGGTTGLLGTSGVPNALAGLCAILGNQQSHNVPLTDL